MTLARPTSNSDRADGAERILHPPATELLVVLLLFIVVTPFLEIIPYGELVQAVILTLALLFAVFVVAESRRMLVVAAIMVTPAFLGKWINYVRPDIMPAEVFLTAALVFVAFVVFSLFRFILRAARVDIQVLSAAVSNYLLMGLLWMFTYILLAELLPGSFAVRGEPVFDRSMDGFNALYFSLVTLCTVGYGDITPLSRPARMLSVLEATAGIFYVAIVIARLVAVYSTEGAHVAPSNGKATARSAGAPATPSRGKSR